jgi:hypothetical protein
MSCSASRRGYRTSTPGSPSAAAAAHLGCGDTITADATLDGDLVNCPNLGIVIGADDITLDLNGHRIDGDGAPATGCRPRRELCDVGVANGGHDGVTVLGISSSRNRFFGIVLGGAARSVVRNSSGL